MLVDILMRKELVTVNELDPCKGGGDSALTGDATNELAQLKMSLIL